MRQIPRQERSPFREALLAYANVDAPSDPKWEVDFAFAATSERLVEEVPAEVSGKTTPASDLENSRQRESLSFSHHAELETAAKASSGNDAPAHHLDEAEALKINLVVATL